MLESKSVSTRVSFGFPSEKRFTVLNLVTDQEILKSRAALDCSYEKSEKGHRSLCEPHIKLGPTGRGGEQDRPKAGCSKRLI